MSGDGGEHAAATAAEPAAVDLPPLLPELWAAIARWDDAKRSACTLGPHAERLSGGTVLTDCPSQT